MKGSRRGAQRPVVTYSQPRLSVLYVLHRVRMRLLDIQVWDVAGTMTFYTVVSVFPGAVAMVSLVSMIGVEAQTITTISALFREVFPTLDPRPFTGAILALASTNGGAWGLALGTLGALVSASNGVAAFHRAMHRVYDTREGRPFLWFRTIVFGETVLLVAVVLLAVGMLTVGGEASQRLGVLIGVPQIAFDAWNLLKWPILLFILIIGVSMAYYLFPNVRLPRYRLVTLGSTLTVLVLFGSALIAGQLMVYATRFAEVLTALNGLIAILLMLWVGNIVIVAGAALDAEFLRARQIASGIDAWHAISLEPHATHSLDYLAADAVTAEEIGRAVADSARTGDPLRRPRSAWIVEAVSALAVRRPDRFPTTQGPEAQRDPKGPAEAHGTPDRPSARHARPDVARPDDARPDDAGSAHGEPGDPRPHEGEPDA